MTRIFVELPEFIKKWKKIGLSDENLWEFEDFLSLHPEFGDIIVGTGGLRKIRWYAKNKGKSGGIRVCYVDFIRKEKIYLITAYAKSKKENISDHEKNEIKRLIENLM